MMKQNMVLVDPQFKYSQSEYNSGQFVSLQPKLCVTRFPILWTLNNLERNISQFLNSVSNLFS